jgi:hypothetical protein
VRPSYRLLTSASESVDFMNFLSLRGADFGARLRDDDETLHDVSIMLLESIPGGFSEITAELSHSAIVLQKPDGSTELQQCFCICSSIVFLFSFCVCIYKRHYTAHAHTQKRLFVFFLFVCLFHFYLRTEIFCDLSLAQTNDECECCQNTNFYFG